MATNTSLNANISFDTNVTDQYGGVITTDQATQYIEYEVAKYLMKYVPPFLLVISLIGNCLAFLVFYRPSLRGSPTAFYFRTLALADMYVILITMLPETVLSFGSIDIVAVSRWNCRLHAWLNYIGFETAAWILVFVSFERLLGILFPLQWKRYLSVQRARVSVICLTIFIALANLSILITMDIQTSVSASGKVVKKCNIIGSGVGVWYATTIFPWIGFLLHAIIPFFLILLSNTVILMCVLHANYKRRKNLSSGQGQDKSMSSMVTILLMTSFTYLLLTGPLCAFVLGSNWFHLQAGNQAFFAKAHLWQKTGKILMFLNHTINFFIYYISGSRFRQEFKSMIFGVDETIQPPTQATRTNSARKDTY